MAGHDSPTTLQHEPGTPVQGSLRRRRPRWSAVVIGLVVVLSLAAYATGSWPSWLSPFQQATVDRSSTQLLLQLQNVAQFQPRPEPGRSGPHPAVWSPIVRSRLPWSATRLGRR